MKKMVLEIWHKAGRDHLYMLAASLAFTSVLSLIPILALAYFFFDTLGGLDKLQGIMENFIVSNLAPAFGDQVAEYVHAVRAQISAGALGVFGVLGFMITSYSMLSKIEYSLGHIWGVKSKRLLLRRITDYWAMITLGPSAMAVSLYVSGMALTWLRGDHGEISKLLLLIFAIVPYLMSAFLITTMFLVLPGFPVPRRQALIAGAVSGFAFEVAKHAYAYYATQTLGRSVYGSLAVLPVFLVWLQWVWIIVLFGAELCHYLTIHPSKQEIQGISND
jgi:membrane protein